MNSLLAYFKPVNPPTAIAYNAPSGRGRPPSGIGSHGGKEQRDCKSRLLSKRARSVALAKQQQESGSEDEEPAARRTFVPRVNWSLPEYHERLLSAVAMVQEKHLSVNRASKLTGVPRTVLAYRVRGKIGVDAHTGPRTALATEDEKQLVEFVLEMAERGFGKDVNEIRLEALRMRAKHGFKATTRWRATLKHA